MYSDFIRQFYLISFTAAQADLPTTIVGWQMAVGKAIIIIIIIII